MAKLWVEYNIKDDILKQRKRQISVLQKTCIYISGGPTVKTQTTSDHVFLIFNILGKFSNTLKYVLIMIHKKAKGTLKENNNCS